jgi:hypothetical protein
MVRSPATGAVFFPIVSHPSLGQAPRSLEAGYPAAAASLRSQKVALAARALEVAVEADPSIRRRYNDVELRGILGDAELLVERLAMSVAGDDVYFLAHFIDGAVVVFRRRRVATPDVARVLEGIRAGAHGVLTGDEMASADRAVDAAIGILKRASNIRGDAKEWNPVTSKLYKGI